VYGNYGSIPGSACFCTKFHDMCAADDVRNILENIRSSTASGYGRKQTGMKSHSAGTRKLISRSVTGQGHWAGVSKAQGNHRCSLFSSEGTEITSWLWLYWCPQTEQTA